MIKLEFDSVICDNNNIISSANSNSQSALPIDSNYTTPFSVKDILNFVDQSEQQQIVGVDCGAIIANGVAAATGFEQNTEQANITMDYCDNRANSLESSYYSIHHHPHHPHNHHSTAAAHFYAHQNHGAVASTPPQFAYADVLCDYNSNYYTPNAYYGHTANYPAYPLSGHEQSMPEMAQKIPSMHHQQIDQVTTETTVKTPSTLLSSPHAQQLDTMCQELEDNESRSRKLLWLTKE